MIAAAAAARRRARRKQEGGSKKWDKMDIAKFRDAIRQRKAEQTDEKREQLDAIKRKMSPEIKEMLIEMFSAFDDDGSGFLSRAEIHDAITNDLGLHVSDDELDSWLAVADADGSDVIDQDEWLILMAEAMEPKKTKEELRYAITKLAAASGHQISADGSLDATSFRNILSDILPSHGVEIGLVNEMLDFIFQEAMDQSQKQAAKLNIDKCIEVLTTRPDLFSSSAASSKQARPSIGLSASVSPNKLMPLQK